MADSNSRSRPTKKAATKKVAKKTGTRKAAAKKTSARKSASARTQSSGEQSSSRQSSAPRVSQIAAQAASELLDLTGKAVEGVTGLERTDDGWTIQVEVVEMRRIPDSTDVLALYEVTTDTQGELLGYRRLRRYARGSAGRSDD